MLIAKIVNSRYQAGRRLSGVMYFHRISDVRMGGISKRNFTMFQRLCGTDAFVNVAIVTTRWDEEEKDVAEARFAELQTKPQLCKPVLDGGGRIFRHDRSVESAREILRHLIAKTAKPLLIQREMVDGRKEVAETTAGRELQQEILQHVERHQKEMMELLKELEQSSDATTLQEIEEECEALREQMVHWEEEGRKLTAISNAGEPEPHVAENSAMPSSNLESPSFTGTSSLVQAFNRPPTDETIPGGGTKTIEAEMGHIKASLLAIQVQLDEDRRNWGEGNARLENVERKLAGVVMFPNLLLGIAGQFLTVLKQVILSRTQPSPAVR